MFTDFIKTAKEEYEARNPFAIAMVVNRKVPTSGKPGDKAVIHEDGTITGWIGGGCTRGIVLKEATLAMRDGKPRLVRISPEGRQESIPGVISYHMSCHSGGMVEVYIEPVMPRPNLIIMGKSHVAMALSRLAKAMDYSVSAVSRGVERTMFPDADVLSEGKLSDGLITRQSFIVVCTQGENDEGALQQAVESGVGYVAFVASRKKANAVFQYLRENGIAIDDLKRIKTPAGLDINAKTPEEVAISILAQIVQYRRSEQPESNGNVNGHSETLTQSDAIYINPVCGVPVEKATAKHVIEYKGESVYFCCDGCKVMFEKEPEKYVEAAG